GGGVRYGEEPGGPPHAGLPLPRTPLRGEAEGGATRRLMEPGAERVRADTAEEAAEAPARVESTAQPTGANGAQPHQAHLTGDRTPAEVLRELLSARRGERHGIVIQDYPDPDAISSALAYREIARGFGIETDILYEGLIS